MERQQMTWKEKLALSREDAAKIPEMIICFSEEPGADESFISQIASAFPFVTEDYLDFLRETDGAIMFVFVLFGSDKSWTRTIFDETAAWKYLIGDAGLVISADAWGNPIVLCNDRRVRLLDFTMEKIQDGLILADSFGSFLSDVLMGDRLPLLCGGEFPEGYETEWLTHLRRHGWI